MTSGRSDLVEIAAEFRMERGNGIAIWDGARNAQGREVWIWLPASLVENHGDGTFTLPEWLAKQEDLI